MKWLSTCGIVHITLIPLGASHELPRKLIINETVKQVEVGRASKNAEKCLIAAQDNAWFDCPIMSRQHAKFSAGSNKVCDQLQPLVGVDPYEHTQRAYLQDNNSTHGTYIGNKRLDAHKDYLINNNEVVSFGVRVTSGTRKSVFAHLQLSSSMYRGLMIACRYLSSQRISCWPRMAASQVCPSSNGMRRFTEILSSLQSADLAKLSNIVSRSTRFHVPEDDDDDENGSSSESSREASVEILDSRIRAYSVPSSDDGDSLDEDDLALIGEAIPQSTTNPGMIVAQPANSTGTTPHHAQEIWTEPLSSKASEPARPCDTESFGSSIINVNVGGISQRFPFATVSKEGHEKVVMSSDSEDEPPEVFSSKELPVQSTPYVPPPSSTQPGDAQFISGGLPIVEPDTVVEPQPTNPEPQRDDCPSKKSARTTLQELKSINEEETDSTGLYFPYSIHNPPALTHFNYISPDYTASSSTPSVFCCVPKSIPEEAQITSIYGKDHPRLAVSCKTITRNTEKDTAPKASVPRRPPSPSDAALVKNAKFVDQRSFWPVMEPNQNQSLIDTPSEYETQFNEAQGIRIGEANPTPSDFLKDRRCYGGFDSLPWTFPHGQSEDRPQINESTNGPAILNLSGSASSNSAAPGSSLEPALFQPCNHDSYVENCTSLALSSDPDAGIFGALNHQTKETGSHCSRLNISDIVHPPLESTRNLKRKADEISVDDAEVETEPNDEARVLPSESSQDVLTDAQPRDITSADEIISFKDASSIPVFTNVPVLTIQQPVISGSSEPPRKKAKTSVFTAAGVGKFVSGVCFGVVGAFAAFIATIPLSVREEAMQELVGSS